MYLNFYRIFKISIIDRKTEWRRRTVLFDAAIQWPRSTSFSPTDFSVYNFTHAFSSTFIHNPTELYFSPRVTHVASIPLCWLGLLFTSWASCKRSHMGNVQQFVGGDDWVRENQARRERENPSSLPRPPTWKAPPESREWTDEPPALAVSRLVLDQGPVGRFVTWLAVVVSPTRSCWKY